jgi:acyl carrier protein
MRIRFARPAETLLIFSLTISAAQQGPASRKIVRQRKAKLDCSVPADIRNKIKQIIIDELGVDERKVKPNARFVEDLGADSLDAVELVMRFEEEFGVEIPDEDCEKLVRVCDVYRYFRSLGRQNR